jgi:hypothetical protein
MHRKKRGEEKSCGGGERNFKRREKADLGCFYFIFFIVFA